MKAAREGLAIARLMMVLSSISPLFIFWAIRGNSLIPEYCFLGFCAFMVIVPTGYLWRRIVMARRLKQLRSILVGKAEDHRDHLLVYLFAMLLPFYSAELDTWRDMATALVALAFIIFLFWHLNLHYMNILFAAFGYHVFTIYPRTDDNPLSGKTSMVLITKRVAVPDDENIEAYRLSNTVYFESGGQ
ncbi:MAG: hypothetical protein AB2717_17020 [Candidatus Thiodiazotropha sp.]